MLFISDLVLAALFEGLGGSKHGSLDLLVGERLHDDVVPAGLEDSGP